MKMTKIYGGVIAVLVAALMGITVAGCGGSGSGSGSGGAGIIREAASIQDGAEKFDKMQTECPVDGGTPIKGDYYAEVNGKRIYFDSQECMNKFKENKQKYLDQYQTYEDQMKEMQKQQK